MSDSDSHRRLRAHPALWLIVAGAAAFSFFVVAQNYWLDDSFITFRYFRNLFEGHGVVYNAGEPAVEGYSNFLWGMVAWLGMRLGAQAIYFTQWVSLAAQAVTLVLTYRIGLKATGNPRRALLAPALLAGQAAFLTYPMTGMESALFCMLVTLAFHLLNGGAHRTRGGALLLGLTAVAMAMTRFDGFVLVGILGAYALFVRRELRSLWLPLGLFVLGLLLFNGWRLSYYPTLLPNSFHAKISFSVMRMGVGWEYVKLFFLGGEFFVSRENIVGQPAALVLLVVALVRFRRSPTRSFLCWTVLLQLAYIVLAGGDWMPHHRFIYHVMPLLLVLVADGAWDLWDLIAPRLPVRKLVGALALAGLLVLNERPLVAARDFAELSGTHFHPHEARTIGEALDRILPDDMLIAIEWGGIIPFYTHHPVLDTYGLTDREITSKPFKRAIWGCLVYPNYIRGRGADLVVPCARLFPTAQEALDAVRDPEGPCHYRYYPDMDNEETGYRLVPIEIATGQWWPALVRRGKWIAAGGARASDAAPSGEPGVALATTRYQVSLFWGGGAPHDWDGSFRIAAPPSGFAADWSWLTDFEAGDRLVAGAEWPAPGNAPDGAPDKPPAPAGDGAAVPARGAVIGGQTDGDADGVCFEVSAVPQATLVVAFGESRTQWTLAQLASGPRSLSLGSGGQAVYASATALDALAPAVSEHFGVLANRVSLHDHSSFSTNLMPIPATLASLRPFVRRVWWTDHNMTSPRAILAGDFEDNAAVARYWKVKRSGARVLNAWLDDEARDGRSGFRVRATGTGPDGRVRVVAEEGEIARQFRVPLDVMPVLRFSWKTSPGTVAFAQLTVSPEGTIRWLSARPPDYDPARDIVLDEQPGPWNDHRRNLRQDALALGLPAGDLAALGFSFGVECPRGVVADAVFDAIALDCPDPPGMIRAARQLLGRDPDLICHFGMEQSAWQGGSSSGPLVPHITLYTPGDATDVFPVLDHEPLAGERRAQVEAVQAAGGCAGTHHMQYHDHYEKLLEGGGFGVDLFEVGTRWWQPPYYATDAERAERDAHGYPRLAEDDVFPLLVRWDRATARGLLMTVYGGPDLNGLFDRPDPRSFNRWLSWILTDDVTQAGLLAALRAGRAVASEWRTSAIVSVDAGEGLGMGKLVVTDLPRLLLTARVSAAPAGSRLRWITMPFARDRAGAPVPEEPPSGRVAGEVTLSGRTGTATLELDATRGGFARAELSNPAGQLIALSNPVYVLPYWPEHWPFGRVAFDWHGVRLLAEEGLALSDARVDPSGRLSLAGTVHADSGALSIAAPHAPAAVSTSAGTWRWNQDLGAIEWSDLPPGDVTASIAFESPLEVGESADLLALPPHKPVVADVVLADEAPGPDGPLIEGFGEPRTMGPGLVGRPVLPPRAVFRLPVPGDRPCWLKLRQAILPGADARPLEGRVLMDGQEIGRLAAHDALTFALPPELTAAPAPTTRTFTLELLADSDPAAAEALVLERIRLHAGPGVVDY